MPKTKKSDFMEISDSVSSRVSRTLRKAASTRLSGFTLVELIVVITILAVLATIGFLALSGYSSDARDAKAKANVRSVHSAISAESALTGNSPRYYVSHDADYALSWAYLYVDGTPVALTGGNIGEAPSDSNYSAGQPRWDRLKLNPENFRTSGISAGSRIALGFAPFLPESFAAFDRTATLAWAADVPTVSGAGRARSVSFFQTAGILPDSWSAVVFGNFPEPSEADLTASESNGKPAAAGFVRNPDAGPDEALTESSPVSGWGGETAANSCSATLPSCNGTSCDLTHSPTSVNQAWVKNASSCGFACTGGYSGTDCMTAPASAFVPWTAYTVGQTFAYTLPDSGETITVTVQGTGVGIASSVADASCTEGGVPAKDIVIWGTSGNPQVWAACNVGAANAMPYANMKFDGTTDDTDVSTAQYAGGIFQWGNNTDVRSAGTWSSTENTNNDAWGNTTNTNAARQWPCPAGYHVPNGGMDAAGSVYTAANNAWYTAYSIAASAGAGTSCDPAIVMTRAHRIRCLLRLPRSGSQRALNGSWGYQGSIGLYWSSSPSSSFAQLADFGASGGNIANGNGVRADGFSVRCLKQ